MGSNLAFWNFQKSMKRLTDASCSTWAKGAASWSSSGRSGSAAALTRHRTTNTRHHTTTRQHTTTIRRHGTLAHQLKPDHPDAVNFTLVTRDGQKHRVTGAVGDNLLYLAHRLAKCSPVRICSRQICVRSGSSPMSEAQARSLINRGSVWPCT